MKKILFKGIIAGFVMGIALFLTGAIASRIIYGPQMVPVGKFDPEQINAWYFFWTKLVIGCFFGIIFTWLYAKYLRISKVSGVFPGLKYGFILWLIISLWGISHPFMYESVFTKSQLFWNIYTLGGFLAYGVTIGALFRK